MFKIVNRKRFSIAASIALIGTLGMSGCSSDSKSKSVDEVPIVETIETIDLSGKIIDGYVSGATVTIGQSESTVDKAVSRKVDIASITDSLFSNSSASIIDAVFSDSSGGWSATLDSPVYPLVIAGSGGTDISTGELFEGQLRAAVERPSVIEDELGGGVDFDAFSSTSFEARVHVSPTSTLAASMVESGRSLQDSYDFLANQFGVGVDSIRGDYIETLKSGTPTQKAESATVVRHSLTVQKAAETVSSSAGTTTEEKNIIFGATFDGYVAMLEENSASETPKTLDEVFADTTKLTQSVATQLESNPDLDSIENLDLKIEASADATAQTVKIVQDIQESTFSEATDVDAVMMTQSKALEILTSAVETSVEKIADATDVEGITSAQEEAVKTTQAITMLGGLSGMVVALEKIALTQAPDETTDASTFSESILSTENIETQSAVYDTLEDAGMTVDMITEIGTQISAETDGETPLDFTQIVADVVEANPEVTISSDALETITAAVEESSVAAEAAEEVAAEEAAVVVEEPAVEEPVVEEPVVEEPVVEEPVVEEPVVEEEETVVNTGGGSSVSNTATATLNSTLDDLTATATLSSTSLEVDTILGSAPSSSVFDVNRTKISLATTGTPTLAQKYAAIKDNLGTYLDIDLSVASVPGAFTNNGEIVTVLVQAADDGFLAISTTANFSSDGNLSVEVPASAELKMAARIDGTTTVTATRTNLSSNLISSDGTTVAFNTASSIQEFAGNALIGDYIKQNIVDYTTQAGTYSVYLIINNSNLSTFISTTDSIVLTDAMVTDLNTLGAMTYTTSHRAIKVNLTVE